MRGVYITPLKTILVKIHLNNLPPKKSSNF
nr:MAG TPA: hypothetical protein [Caudoviricetes sp.]